MALVTSVVRDERNFRSIHPTEVSAYYLVAELDGKKVLQINTYGSAGRDVPGKLSQTLQFNEQSAREIFAVLKKEFGL